MTSVGGVMKVVTAVVLTVAAIVAMIDDLNDEAKE